MWHLWDSVFCPCDIIWLFLVGWIPQNECFWLAESLCGTLCEDTASASDTVGCGNGKMRAGWRWESVLVCDVDTCVLCLSGRVYQCVMLIHMCFAWHRECVNVWHWYTCALLTMESMLVCDVDVVWFAHRGERVGVWSHWCWYMCDLLARFSAIDGSLLLEMRRVRKAAPEFFYRTLQQDLRMDLATALRFSQLLGKLAWGRCVARGSCIDTCHFHRA